MPETAPVAPASIASPDLLGRLAHVCRERELGALGARLAALAELVAPDVRRLEAALPELRGAGSAVERGAGHLLDLGGKRLRPICVALAARLGSGLDARGLELAVAVELVHAATLLHDDVVDLGDTRRGAPSARAVFGNAVSIFAGDWLLVDALRRVRRVEVPLVLERLLDVIEEMILAESRQLERRGRLDLTEEEWLAVIDGKTAALFRWALYAGGRAGGLDEETCAVLERYGRHLGIAFQAIDDVLDVVGDPRETGKAVFADMSEGKLTYPFIFALRREPTLAARLRRAETDASPALLAEIRACLARTGAVEACRALAQEHAALAKASLAALPPSPARAALETVADAAVHRPR